MDTLNSPQNAKCPVCDAEISLETGTEIGEILVCAECSTELEVTGISPATLAQAPETEEDWGE